MVFRNCMSFGPYRPWNRPPAPTIINRNIYVNPQPYGCYSNYGNNAFWGGFVGGFLSGGLNFLGRMFGTQNYGGTNMYSPMTTYYSPYSMLNQNAERLPEGSSELKILEKHYGEKYNISESGGKFYATPKDLSGKTIIANSYEEMLRLLGGETPDPRADEIKATRLAKEKEDFNANEQVREKGASIKVIGLEGEETTTEETNDNRYKFELTYQDANGNPKVEVVDTITDAYEILGILDPDPASANDDNAELRDVLATLNGQGTTEQITYVNNLDAFKDKGLTLTYETEGDGTGEYVITHKDGTETSYNSIEDAVRDALTTNLSFVARRTTYYNPDRSKTVLVIEENDSGTVQLINKLTNDTISGHKDNNKIYLQINDEEVELNKYLKDNNLAIKIADD